MVLGLLLAGMAFGAGSALWWLASGGSILAALCLYSLVSVAVILGVAAVAFVLGERGRTEDTEGEALRPADQPVS